MNLLAIDTSTEVASVALMIGDVFFCETQESPKTHAQFLLPIIDKLMAAADLQMQQLDGIVFGCGPGSFTGLRIACSIAKGLAFAHDLGLIPVDSLEAIAWEARALQGTLALPVLAVLDARMNELYWSYFAPGVLQSESKVTAAAKIIVPASQQPIILAGLGIDAYWDDLSESLKSQVSTKLALYPNAATMIRLVQYTAKKPIAAELAQPVYVRNQVTQGDSSG